MEYLKPSLANVKDHYEVDKTKERVHVPSESDLTARERFNARVDFLRQTGRITQIEAVWAKVDYKDGDFDDAA